MVDIKDLKIGNKAVNIIVQVREIGDIREFDYQGTNHRVATSIVEDKTGSIDMPLFNDEIDRVKVGDVVKISNGYVGEFNGITQLRAGKYGKLEVVSTEKSRKAPEDILKEKKVDKKLKLPKQRELVENWCKKCGKIENPVILEDYDGMCVPCSKGFKNEEGEEEFDQ